MSFGLDLGNLIVHLKADAEQYNQVLSKAEERLTKTANKLNAIGRSLTMRVTAPLVAMGLAATKSFASFDDAMTKSLAIMKDVTPDLRKEMESLAVSISKKSVTSATELAKSYFYLASAGLSAQQSIAALPVVEKFAIAGAFDMALATDLVTDAQSALGLTVKDSIKNMENMGRITDVLVAANTLANASTQQFSEALMRAGPAMKAFGIEVEEGTAVLAAYADQGKKGAEGGELFGRMLRLMIKGFVDNKEAWDKFNISIVDAEDNLRPMADIIRDLTNLLGGMGVTQKASTLEMLGFQARSQQAIMPLLGLGDAVENYYEELLKANGITKEIADNQLKSFSSQMKIVWNNIKAVGIAIGRILSPYILKLNEQVVKATEFWNSLNESTQRSVVVYGMLAAAIGPVLIATGLLLKTLAFMITTVKTLTLVFTNLVGVLTAPVAVILLLIAAAYALRAAWNQNVEAIKNRLEALGSYFKQAYSYIANSVIGKFLKWFKKEFTTFFKEAKEELGDFAKDTAGMWAGIKALIKGDDFWQAFVEGREKADQAFKGVKKAAVDAFDTSVLYVKAYGEATAEHLESLMDAVKTQFGEDADAIIALIKSKMTTLQNIKLPAEPYEARVGREASYEIGTKPLEDQLTVTRALAAEEMKRAEVLATTNVTVQAMLDALDFELSMLGKTSEERERAISLSQFQLALQEMIGEEMLETIEGQARYNELMDEYVAKLDLISEEWRRIKEKQDESLEGFEAVNEAVEVWTDRAMNWGKNLGNVLVNAFDRAAESFAGMLMKEEVNWKAFGRMFVRELLVMIVKLQMAVALKAALGGLGSVFGGGGEGGTFTNTQAVYGAPPGLQHGGTVLKTGLAVVHEGEDFIPRDKQASSSNFEPQIKVVFVKDEREAILETMRSEPGERVIMQKVNRNRQSLG